jgi:hypothetical protein
MIKSSTPYITYIILSILVVFFAQYINDIVMAIVEFYNIIDNHLEIFFNQSSAGILTRSAVALVACPLILTGTPALIYYAVKRSKMPYFIEVTWLAWVIIVLSNLLIK